MNEQLFVVICILFALTVSVCISEIIKLKREINEKNKLLMNGITVVSQDYQDKVKVPKRIVTGMMSDIMLGKCPKKYAERQRCRIIKGN